MSFLGLFGTAKAAESAVEGAAAFVTKGMDLVDKWGYTKQEQAEDAGKAEDRFNQFHGVMEKLAEGAQIIRSQTRAKLVKLVVYPYVFVWCIQLPIAMIQVVAPEYAGVIAHILEMMQGWLEGYKILVAAVAGPYIGYYGVQQVVGTIRNRH